MTLLSAAAALLLTPFIGGMALVITFVLAWVARYDRTPRNRYMEAVERGRERGRS